MSRVYTIPPKPTLYAGVLFRSLLESEWAEFFDQKLIRWSYEPRAYHLPCRPWQWYKPDFLFPDFKAYGEVKPDCSDVEDGMTPEEYALCGELCIRTGYRVVMLIGEPDNGPWPSLVFRDGDAHLEDWSFE